MSDGNASERYSKSRSVLGDLTNRLGKRGFSEREKSAVKSFSFGDKSKRVRVSPRPCTEINSLKGNVVSSISILKMPNENSDRNMPDLGSGVAVTKSLVDVETNSDDGPSLKGKNSLMGNSKDCGESKDIKVSDLGEKIAVSGSVNEMNVDNCLVDRLEIGCPKNDASEKDKIATQNYESNKLTDLEEGRAVDSVTLEADDGDKLGLLKENEVLGTAEIVSENNFTREDVIDCIKVSMRENNVHQSVNTEENDELGDSFLADTSRTVSETVNDDELKAGFEGTQSDMNDYQNDVDDHNADNLVMSQCGSIDCTILPESQESRVFGVDGSTEPKKGDECAYISGGIDSIRDCSCSFCTKAGYMLLDLNYQDIKARVSAMRKSQKEANILAERSIMNKGIETLGTERVSKLESELMYQWRSLFQHMADIWDEEGNQLEAKLVPLTELREKCKTDMQLTNEKR